MMLTRHEFDILKFLDKRRDNTAQSLEMLLSGLKIDQRSLVEACDVLLNKKYIEDGRITNRGIEALKPYKVKRAILMAAGFGSRMRPITVNTPKPLVRVNGTRIIDTLIDGLLKANIEEIYVVRGYLSEQFDQLLIKYPMIKFIDNPYFETANNISSIFCAGSLTANSYIIEADIFIRNLDVIEEYQYQSHYLGIPVEHTDDYCLYVENGYITGSGIGGDHCYQTVGISYWTEEDGKKISEQIKPIFDTDEGRQRFWGSVPMSYHKDEYKVGIRECSLEDVVEIDSFEELMKLDPIYRI